MSKDPNTLGPDDYYDMSIKDRCLLDDWLKSLGARPNKTKSIRLNIDDSTVTIVEFKVENNDKNYTRNALVGETEIILPYTEGPPVWKV